MPDLRNAAKQLFDAMNNGDWDTIRAALHPDYIYTGPNGEEARGVEAGLAAASTDYNAAFPDMHVEIIALYADGDVVITEFTATGTHNGPFAGIAPTGKRVEVAVCNLMQFREGKLYHERDYLDTLSLFAQLGAVEAP